MLQDFLDYKLPSNKDEEWRFSPLNDIYSYFNNYKEDSGIENNIKGGEVSVSKNHYGKNFDYFSYLAYKNSQHMHILGNSNISINRNGISAKKPVYMYTNIEAKVDLDLSMVYTGNSAFIDIIVLDISPNVNVNCQLINKSLDETLHMGYLFVNLQSNARFIANELIYGGKIVRTVTDVNILGNGVYVDIGGFTYASNGRYIENRVQLNSVSPNCYARVDYRSIGYGNKSYTVWIGDVYIAKESTGIDVFENNKHLLLTPGAIAESVPNLEIETGDVVAAGHASAISTFDEEELFYLLSRGISYIDAINLIISGYVNFISARTDVLDDVLNIIKSDINNDDT